MSASAYKSVVYRQDDAWVAEIPAIPGCHALMPTRELALEELRHVFEMIAEQYREQGRDLPADTTEFVNAWRNRAGVPTSREPARIRAPAAGRQVGSHERWNHPDGRAVTIPLHGGRAIGPPLFYKLLRQLGVTPDRFDALR